MYAVENRLNIFMPAYTAIIIKQIYQKEKLFKIKKSF